MPETNPQKTAGRRIERTLAAIALLFCLAVDALVVAQYSPLQVMWPLPALYLVEMLLVSAAGVYGIFRGPSWLAWAASGAVLGYALVGTWTIGILYVPVWAFLLAAGVISARRQHTPWPGLFALSLAAALLQAGLILGVAKLIFR